MESHVSVKADVAAATEPTASSLKRELRESLELLKRDFEGLNNFVAEIAPEGQSPPIPLSER